MNTNERIARTIQRIVFTGGYENIPAKVRIADNIAEAVIADLSAAGSAIVPREPTEEMRKQGTHQIWLGGDFPDRAIRVYESMVAASEEGK